LIYSMAFFGLIDIYKEHLKTMDYNLNNWLKKLISGTLGEPTLSPLEQLLDSFVQNLPDDYEQLSLEDRKSLLKIWSDKIKQHIN
jgi:hypothetical protein